MTARFAIGRSDDVTNGDRRWTALTGRFTFDPPVIRFHGGTATYGETTGASFGMALCDQ
jgi:hypothetical protein